MLTGKFNHITLGNTVYEIHQLLELYDTQQSIKGSEKFHDKETCLTSFDPMLLKCI